MENGHTITATFESVLSASASVRQRNCIFSRLRSIVVKCQRIAFVHRVDKLTAACPISFLYFHLPLTVAWVLQKRKHSERIQMGRKRRQDRSRRSNGRRKQRRCDTYERIQTECENSRRRMPRIYGVRYKSSAVG